METTMTTHDDKTTFSSQVLILTIRYIQTILRTPGAYLPSLVLSIFTLLIYTASLGGAAAFIPGLIGKSYLAFILPGAVLNSALSSSGIAGQSIVRDIASGYFDKLMLTPVSRGAVLLSAMFAGAIVLGVQTTLVTIVGLLLGLNPPTGLAGLLAIIVIALLVGNALAGLTVGVGLRSGNPAATQGISFLFFPLTLLTAAFVPYDLLQGWIRVAAQLNPVTYILQAMRTILMDGWGNTSEILLGTLIAVALGLVTFIFAAFSLRVRTRQR
jgi:ABC-2 type transport system permease protein